MTLLDCVELGPEGSAARGSVVWMHGLGADGHDFEPIVPMLGLPDVRFVFPHAPTRPVTLNGGFVMRAWYDITTLERVPEREPEADVRASAELIEALLAREVERGTPSERTVLAGFSQGAAMALHVGVRHQHPLAGLMILSGYRLLPQTWDAERSDANRKTPTLCCHGTTDDVLTIDQGREAYETLAAGQADVQWHEFPIGHGVSEDEIAVVKTWLAARFA